MIFQHTWEKVLSGEKTQTRRLINPNDRFTTAVAQVVLGKDIGRVIQTVPTPYRAVSYNRHVYSVCAGNKPKWRIHGDYAVQPSRTHPAMIYHPEHPCYGIDIIDPGDDHYQMAKSGEWNYRGQGYIQARIRITDIRREDVRTISAEDAHAEGFGTDPCYSAQFAFLETWIFMHDKELWRKLPRDAVMPGWRLAQIPDPVSRLQSRPAALYDAWVLTFEAVR